MRLCVRVCVCKNVCAGMSVCVCMCMCMCVHVHVCRCLYMCAFVCTRVCVCVGGGATRVRVCQYCASITQSHKSYEVHV